MSNREYASPLRLEIRESRRLLAIVVVIHTGAFIMSAISIVPVSIKFLLTLMLICSLLLFFSYNSQSYRIRGLEKYFQSIKSVTWRHDNFWDLETYEGRHLQAQLSGNSFVHPWLTIVNLKLMGQPWYRRNRSLLVLPDNVDSENFRRLRVRLRQLSNSDQDNSPVLK